MTDAATTAADLKTIDLNLDAGEFAPGTKEREEELLFDSVSSVNIACGAHAGEEATMRRCIQLAKARGLAIGAHPSYPDRENFGRKEMKISPLDLKNSLTEQLLRLSEICKQEKVELSHVKPHGSLYNVCARDEVTAYIFSNSVSQVFAREKLPLMVGLANSLALKIWKSEGLTVIGEGFIDRLYQKDGSLVPRNAPDAVHFDIEHIVEQALTLACGRPIHSRERTPLRLDVQTLCIHGDHENSVEIARRVRQELLRANIKIKRPSSRFHD